MISHQQLDRLGLRLAREVVMRIDADPERKGLVIARNNCERWLAQEPCAAYLEWRDILQRSWPEVRAILLDESDEGQRVRQSNPFCGVLTPQERWRIIKAERADAAA